MGKEEKGITLITLVVTTIVLLLLAGITMFLIIGENGIIEKSKLANKEQTIAQMKEDLTLKIGEIQIQKQANASLEYDIIQSNIQMEPYDIIVGDLEQDKNGTKIKKITMSQKEMTQTFIIDEYLIINKIETIANNGQSGNQDSKQQSNFFFSTDGFEKKLGNGSFHSLYGLTADTYEVIPEDSWEHCIYEKEISPFSLTGEFEISFQYRLATSYASQMGGINVNMQTITTESEKNTIGISISDAWSGRSAISRSATYHNIALYTETYQNMSGRYSTFAIIGDGSNVSFYCDSTCLATTPQLPDLSCNKIVIDFKKYIGYNQPSENYIENIYYGPIRRYLDVIK